MELEFASNGLLEDSIYEIGADVDATGLENERCGICMDVIIDRGVLDCCEHWFCFACIDNWATITNLCPLCQNEFQLITCVPVYDTIGSGRVEDDSLSRDNDWCIEGENNTLSFPSYYIDENAVICLDGNGCKIRKGVETSGDDAILDTSIACDSCDLWYHAFCVDFDPENTSENSWLCPRCIDEVPQRSDGVSLQLETDRYGPESTSCEDSVGTSHSGKVSVSVADAGETAIVVSMIEGKHWIKEPGENCPPAQDNNKTNQTLDKRSDSQAYTDAEKKSLDLSLSRHTHFAVDSLHLKKMETDITDEAVSEPNVSNRCELFTGLLSDVPKIENESSQVESNVDLHLGLSVGDSLPADKMNSDGTENHKAEVSQRHNLFKDFSLSVDKMDLDVNEDAVGPSCVKRKSMSSRDHDLVSGHNEVNNMDTRRKIASDLPSKKAKGDGKSQQKRAKDEGRIHISGSTQESSHLLAGPKDKIDNSCTIGEMVTTVPAKKDKTDGKSQQPHLKPEVKKPRSGGTQECAHPSAVSKDVKLRNVAEQEDRTPDIMSIVRGSNRRPGGLSRPKPADKSLTERDNGAGLRVKKIMRRAAEDESSKLVENLRKEIREAVRSNTSKDLSKANLLDPKLLLAFRNVLAGTRPEQEPRKKLDPSIVRAKRSMLQKGKIRESLTKKIYGNSNGRRKRAWDRDWEVEFWKHRCAGVTQPEKVETLNRVLDLLRRSPECPKMESEPKEAATNPILSRLYLADSSVFPRKDDIKPLSALTGSGNDETNKESTVKENVSKSVKDNISRTVLQPHKNSSQSSKDESSCKKVNSNGSISKQNSTSMAGGSKLDNQLPEEMPGNSDTKIDKRKWALEVLARKTATVQRNVTQGKEDDNTLLKGNFPLLAQLPPDMRPVLATSRHNKVPASVRQAQLYRLAEHFLRKADLPVIRRTADTELAVADAVNIEKEVVNKSNSKLVYLNLCSQVLLQQINNKKPENAAESDPPQPVVHAESIDPAPEEILDLSAEAALRMAGLVDDSPPNSPCHPDDDDSNPETIREKEPDNVFDIDTHVELDIYGDFEYDLENEDYIGGIVPKVYKPQTEEGDSKVKVVFSTLSTQKEDGATNQKDNDMVEIVNELKVSTCNELHKKDQEVSLDVRSESPRPPPEPLQEDIDAELSLAECEELYGPDKEPLVNKYPEKAPSSIGEDSLAENKSPSENAKCHPNNTASEFDTDGSAENRLVKSGLPARCNSSGAENSSNPSSGKDNLPRKEKKTNKKKQSDIIHSISKKVEAYIKEHIRPLCKSGVITVDQYRWAVERTTTKIMKYHSKDTNANFLIKEGEKVKKLAEQYVEAAQKKKDDT